MKVTFALVFSSYFLVAVFAQKCIEQAECDETTCCAGYPPFGGVCQPFTPEGGKCHVVDKVVPIFGDFLIGSCPCEEGLVCVQQGEKKNNGICQVPPTTPAPASEAATAETDAPVNPASEAAPAQAAPAQAAPAVAAPAEAAPAQAAPAQAAPAQAAPAQAAPAQAAPVEAAPAVAAPSEE